MKLVFCISVASYFYLWFILCTIFYWFLNSWYCLLFCICSILIISDIVFLSVSFVVSYFFYFIPAFRPNFSPQCLLFCCTLSLFSKWVPLLTCLAIGLHNLFFRNPQSFVSTAGSPTHKRGRPRWHKMSLLLLNLLGCFIWSTPLSGTLRNFSRSHTLHL